MDTILVVGSSNIDMIAQVDHLPLPGETVGEAKYSMAYGGKGANQAVAAAKAGGAVTFLTRSGKDAESKQMVNSFEEIGINTEYIQTSDTSSTGVALILVDKFGENCIAVAPEANGELLPEFIEDRMFDEADIVLLQLEIPIETVKVTALKAKSKGKKVILNPAPVKELDAELLACVDVLVLNQTEAETISGFSIVENGEKGVLVKIAEVCKGIIILTLGKEGSCLYENGSITRIPAYEVKALDSTAAGDTYCGVLAVKMAEGEPILDAILYASAAAAVSVTRSGAQPSAPSKKEIDAFIETAN